MIPKQQTKEHIAHYKPYCKVCLTKQVLDGYYEKHEDKKEYQREYAKRTLKERKSSVDYKIKATAYQERFSKATPKCLPKSERLKNRSIYKSSVKKTLEGIPHNVDHIVPLKNQFVCGLHVPWNLRIITALENNYKSNQIDNNLLNQLYTNYQPFEITEDLINLVYQFKQQK